MVMILSKLSCTSVVSNSSFTPMTPTVSPSVTLSLTIFYMVMYCLLFSIVYVQLWLILMYNYKRFSFQSVFLFLCALWSGLRATLFSFYFNNTMQANKLPLFWYWLLYCFPVCLQFCTLCLLNLYFAQVMFKSKAKYAANPLRYNKESISGSKLLNASCYRTLPQVGANNSTYQIPKGCPLRTVCLSAVLVFLTMNVSCAVIVQSPGFNLDDVGLVSTMVTIRVILNDMLFVVFAISLSYSIFKISKTTSANILLEAKGTTVCQAATVGFMIVLLYSSRAVYNIIAVSPLRCKGISSFNFDWYNVSDQADQVELKDLHYVVFGVVLFVWELLPTGLVIFFFRVKKPDNTSVNNGLLNSHSYNSRVYFFDNPHRYDSDEDSPESTSTWQNGTSNNSGMTRNLSSASYNGVVYGSMHTQRVGPSNGLIGSPSSIENNSYRKQRDQHRARFQRNPLAEE